MANKGQGEQESVGSHKENLFVNLERRRDKQHTLSIVWKVNRLRKKLRRRKHDRRSPSSPSSEGSRESRDRSYRCRSRTPPSETYSASSCWDKLKKSNNRCEKGPSHHT
nr:hypothetical protein CFP56_60633 [Quercus suber]POF13403.1 hypothetical protein CFP56_60634 [Quercus suber]